MGKSEGKNHSEDPDVDGKIILIWIFRKWDRSVNCIAPTQKRDRRSALVKAVMNIRVP